MIKIYEIQQADLGKIKKILEAPEKVEGKIVVNPFARQGYKLRDAKTIGVEKAVHYLYIDAAEDFFERNEKVLLDNGAKALEGEELENIKKKIEEQEAAAEAGVGFIFGE